MCSAILKLLVVHVDCSNSAARMSNTCLFGHIGALYVRTHRMHLCICMHLYTQRMKRRREKKMDSKIIDVCE